MVFCNKSGGKRTEPLIIGHGCPCPDGTRMIPMSGAVSAGPRLRRRCIGQIQAITENYMLRRPEELRGFEDHLDYVFVTVPLRSTGRIHR